MWISDFLAVQVCMPPSVRTLPMTTSWTNFRGHGAKAWPSFGEDSAIRKPKATLRTCTSRTCSLCALSRKLHHCLRYIHIRLLLCYCTCDMHAPFCTVASVGSKSILFCLAPQLYRWERVHRRGLFASCGNCGITWNMCEQLRICHARSAISGRAKR